MLSVEQRDFARALDRVKPALAARAARPALGGVRLVGAGGCPGYGSLEATDLEIGVRATFPAEGELATCLVPGRALAAAVRAHDKGDSLAFEVEGTALLLAARGSGTRIGLLALEGFPAAHTAGETYIGRLDGPMLTGALAKVALAASTDEDRPVLTGVLFEPAEAGLRLVATDSHRLASLTLAVEWQRRRACWCPAGCAS